MENNLAFGTYKKKHPHIVSTFSIFGFHWYGIAFITCHNVLASKGGTKGNHIAYSQYLRLTCTRWENLLDKNHEVIERIIWNYPHEISR